MQFRKKPVVINAYKLPDAGQKVDVSFHDWCEEVGFVNWASGRDETLEIPTLEGVMTAQPGDWIIKGVKGEFYPCKPDIFAATYEAAEQATVGYTDFDLNDGFRFRLALRDLKCGGACDLDVLKLNLKMGGRKAALKYLNGHMQPMIEGILDEWIKRAPAEAVGVEDES